MRISKIELRSHGLKGLKVSYLKEKEVDGATFTYEHQVKVSRPVGKLLKDKIKELVPFFVDLMKIGKYQSFAILAVNSNEKDGFGFKVRVSCEYTTYEVEPQMVDESYNKYTQVMEIITSIYDMTVEYLQAKDKMDARQYMMDLQSSDVKAAKQFAEMDFENLPIGDVKAQMIKALEATGCIIIDSDDQGKEDDDDNVVQMKKTG